MCEMAATLTGYPCQCMKRVVTAYGLNIFYFISHGKGLGRTKMLCHSPSSYCICVHAWPEGDE